MKKETKSKMIKILVAVIVAIIFSFVLEKVIFFDADKGFFEIEVSKIFISRIILLFILIIFIELHFIFSIREFYSWMFRKRYLIALAVFLFMVLNQYHGSSIAMFDQYVQPGEGGEYTETVFGAPRPIRSDEWAVSTPNRLSSQYGEDPYSEYNYIMRGTKTPNIAAGNNMYLNYGSLANPLMLGFFVFGQEYGQSIYWYGTIILTFLVSIEMCMIISKKNKCVSVMGAFVIVFSGFYQWWVPVTWVLGSQAAIVCGYYFLQNNEKWKRILLSVGLAFSLAYFVTILYPAWQVPVGYLFLGILIWIMVDNWKKIKALSYFDWGLLAFSFLFAASIIIAYLSANSEYSSAIMNTAYPGKRISVGGDLTLSKLFYWFYNPLFVLKYEFFSNTSGMSSFISFFPIPLIMSLWYIIKEKSRDLLTIILIIISLVFASFVVFGWPEWLAKITLMSYSPSYRAIDILMFTQVYLLIAVMSRFEKCNKMPNWCGYVLVGCILPLYIATNLQDFPEVGVPTKYIVLISVVFCFIIMGIVTKTNIKIKVYTALAIIGIAAATGFFVQPIQKGFDVIYSKPVSYKIQEIVEQEPEAKWIALENDTNMYDFGNRVAQQFLVANGASTINSVNVIPNMELWNSLDPDQEYSQVYNRYAHILIELTEGETTFELLFEDCFRINLSYDDLEKVGVKYIYTTKDLSSNEEVTFDKVYDEYGSKIYKIVE